MSCVKVSNLFEFWIVIRVLQQCPDVVNFYFYRNKSSATAVESDIRLLIMYAIFGQKFKHGKPVVYQTRFRFYRHF